MARQFTREENDRQEIGNNARGEEKSRVGGRNHEHRKRRTARGAKLQPPGSPACLPYCAAFLGAYSNPNSCKPNSSHVHPVK
jgi:hypothetical protein